MSSPRSPGDESSKKLLSTCQPSHRRRRHLGLSLRRRRIPTIRLGGRRGWHAGGRFFVGFLRRLRLRYLVSQYLKAMKRMKACCSELTRDIIDGAAAMESVQARMLMETYYFTVPIMPVSVVGNYLGRSSSAL